MEFEIAGQTYRAEKLNAFQQFHVSRRLAPVLAGLAAGSEGEGFASYLKPITDALAGMSDEQCDFILQTCLGAVQRQQGNSWSPIFAAGRKTLMFDDIDLSAMMQIAVQVIQDNLGSFFRDGAAALNVQAPTTA